MTTASTAPGPSSSALPAGTSGPLPTSAGPEAAGASPKVTVRGPAGIASRTGEPLPDDAALRAEMGATLHRHREAAGLSREDIVRIAGFGESSTVGTIERGAATRASRLRPWLTALGMDIEPFLERYASVIAAESRFPTAPRQAKPARSPKTHRGLAPPPSPDQVGSARAALGAALWGLRVKGQLSRPQLARLADVSRITVYLVEHGQRTLEWGTFLRWCRALRTGAAEPYAMAAKHHSAIAPDRRRRVGVPPGPLGHAPTVEGTTEGSTT